MGRTKKIARSSAPYYDTLGAEGVKIDQKAIDVLSKDIGAVAILSFNENKNMPGENLLGPAKIAYKHIQIPDFTAPTVKNIEDGVSFVEGNSGTLVFCGYGKGRTGTFIAAWDIYTQWKRTGKYNGKFDLKYMGDNYGVEKQEQVDVLKSYYTKLTGKTL